MYVIHESEEGESAQNETIAEYDVDWSYPEGPEPTAHYDESEEAVTGQREVESGSTRPVRAEALTAATPLGPQEIGSDSCRIRLRSDTRSSSVEGTSS